jgi:hypothetical protein
MAKSPYINRMELTPQTIQRFTAALPGVRKAIDQVIAQHSARAVPVSSLKFPRLVKCFPNDFLRRANVVVVKKMPVLPLDQLGLSGLSQELPDGTGFTLKDTYFVREGAEKSESLHFHELVHVAQWQCLGVDRFLIAYGIGLVQVGYRHSPLEEMAYSLQAEFDRGIDKGRLIEAIQRGSEDIWKHLAAQIPPLAAFES